MPVAKIQRILAPVFYSLEEIYLSLRLPYLIVMLNKRGIAYADSYSMDKSVC